MAGFWQLLAKTAAAHTVTYFIVGVTAYLLFDYRSLLDTTALGANFRSMSDPVFIAAPALQPIRGVLFGAVIYTLREPFLQSKRGWLSLWLVFITVGVLGTFGSPPGSIEGVLYTTLPWSLHLVTLPELLVQPLALATVLYWWVNHPGQKWVNWAMGTACALVVLFPAMALTMAGR
jgi:hypothetical protein